MQFVSTPLSGVFLIEPELREDERGFFARTWCTNEFAEHSLKPALAQISVSFNHKRGTLRGMHYQIAPHEETKVVRCTAGAIYDVVLDLRTSSPTYRKWYAAELTAQNHRAFYIPEGCAHGFITLADATEVLYLIGEFQHAESARGVRWNDPAFGIEWPLEPTVLSSRDATYPLVGEVA